MSATSISNHFKNAKQILRFLLKTGELFRDYRISPEVLDEVEAHPQLQVVQLLDYFRDTYAGQSKTSCV